MPSFLENMNLRNLFQTPGFPKPPTRTPPYMPPPQEEQYPMMEEYKQAISNIPRREDYKPSPMRTILASAAGGLEGYASQDPGAAFSTGMGISELPYRHALQEYGQQTGALGEGARLESQGAADKYKTMMDQLNYERNLRRDEAYIKSQESQAGLRETQGKLNVVNAERITQEMNEADLGAPWTDDDGIHFLDKKTKKVLTIPMNKMNPQQLAVLRSGLSRQNQTALQGLIQSGQLNIQEVRQEFTTSEREAGEEHDISMEGVKQEGRLETIGAKGVKGPNAAEMGRRDELAMRRIMEQMSAEDVEVKPNWWDKRDDWFVPNDSGNWVINPDIPPTRRIELREMIDKEKAKIFPSETENPQDDRELARQYLDEEGYNSEDMDIDTFLANPINKEVLREWIESR